MTDQTEQTDQAAPADRAGDPTPLREQLEAVLMVVDEPVTVAQLAEATGADAGAVGAALTRLARDYDGEGSTAVDGGAGGTVRRGFELRELAGGWRIYSRPAHAEVVERFIVEGQTARLTQAALEALAVVAYLQPVTRSRVAGIRGVNSDSVMRTLISRGLLAETGTDPHTGAVLYGTTGLLLELLGVGSLEELPPLSEHLPGLTEVENLIAEGERTGDPSF